MFEAIRDVLYAETKAEYSGKPGFVALAEEVQRDAFLRHMEREWPSVQLSLKAYPDAKLAVLLAECVEHGDGLGQKPTYDDMLREMARQAQVTGKERDDTPGRGR